MAAAARGLLTGPQNLPLGDQTSVSRRGLPDACQQSPPSITMPSSAHRTPSTRQRARNSGKVSLTHVSRVFHSHGPLSEGVPLRVYISNVRYNYLSSPG